MITNGLGISKNPLNDISKVYLESVAKTPEVNEINEGIRDKDPEKGTKERKARLEKKRGMKVDDHPEYKKGVEAPKEKLKTDRDGYRVPKKDADAARERLLAKAKALRAKKEKDQKKSVNEDAFDPGLVDRKRREQDRPKDKVTQTPADPRQDRPKDKVTQTPADPRQDRPKDKVPTTPNTMRPGRTSGGKSTTTPNTMRPGRTSGGKSTTTPTTPNTMRPGRTSGGKSTTTPTTPNSVKSKPLATLNRGEKGDGFLGPTITIPSSGGKKRIGIPNISPIRNEALDPVGKEDGDVNNDGKKDDTDSYLLKRRKAIGKAIKKKKGIKEEEHRIGGGNLATLAKKAAKRIDADVDGDVDTDDMKSVETGEFVPGVDGKKVKSTFRAEEKTAGSPEHKPGGSLSQYDAQGKPKAKVKVKVYKEGYHNWRQDLVEVMDDIEDQKEVKEKKINNKIKINPELGEAVEEIGGTLIEMIEVDEMDVIIESVYEELIEEGYSEDDVEDAIEYSLIEAKVTYGHDTPTKKGEMMKKAKGRLRYLGRKAKEKFGSAKKKVGMASAKAQVAGYNKLRDIAQTADDTKRRAKKAVADVPKKAKKKGKSLLRRAAQKVVDRMSEELEVSEQVGKLIPGEGPGPGTGGGGSSISTSEIRRRNDAYIKQNRQDKALRDQEKSAIRARAEQGMKKLDAQGGAVKAIKRLRTQAGVDYENDPNMVKTAPGIYRSKQAIEAGKPLQQRLRELPSNVKRRAAQKGMSEETLTEKDTGSFFDGAKGGKYDKSAKQLKSPDPTHRFWRSSPTMNPDKKPAKPKPTPQRQTGDKAKDRATWAKANPTLANKAKTSNPLMKNFYTGKPDMAAVRAKAKADTLSRSRLGEELSIDDQMKISRDYNRMSPEEKKKANKKALGKIKKVKREKDKRTDAEKMTDATGPRKGSRYRGD